MSQRLSDYEFFTECIGDVCEIAPSLKEAAKRGDMTFCRKSFAEYVRSFILQSPYRQHILKEKTADGEAEGITDAAKRYIEGKVVSVEIPYDFKGKIDWEYNPTPDRYREWTWQLSRHPEFITLAKAYILTGDEQYARGYADIILGWIDQATVPKTGVSGGETECWRTIEAGIRLMSSWNYAIHIFALSESVDDDALTAIMKSVWEHGQRLRHDFTTCNWLLMEMDGLVHIGVLYPFFKQSAEWEGFAVSRLEAEGSAQLYPDGFQFELTTNYHHVFLINYLNVLKTYKIMGKPSPEKLLKCVEHACEIYGVLASPDMRLPDLNDGNRFKLCDALSAAVSFLPWRKDLLWLQSDRKKGERPSYISKALYWSGVAIMRSDWSENALWLMHEAAPLGMGHQHEDKNGIELQAYGKKFITEVGSNAYDGSTRHIYALSSAGHNTMLTDGLGQNRRETYLRSYECTRKKSGMGFYSCDDFDVSEGIYNEGYGPSHIRVSHIRRVLFLKRPDFTKPFFIIIDRAVNCDVLPHTYQLLWHFEDEKYEYSEKDKRFKLWYENGPSLTVLSPSADNTQVIRGQEKPFYQGFKASYNVNEVLYSPTLICSYTSERPVRMVTVLAPSSSKEAAVTSASASSRYEATEISVTSGGKTVTVDEKEYFSKLVY